ncbi:hypothetical protein [Clostridium sp. YIM B02500]|uniref:hypothetical protein n=1 Tax=Clostridium sp. YIM B02500 TaxID=2910681 RepID=UPI001EED6962|nr:hypothetical protein [Clostridium sp. YIM B02500]
MENTTNTKSETAQEAQAQEQLKELYPVDMTLIYPIGNGFEVINDTILDSSSAIKIHVSIDCNKYSKQKVYESLKTAYQRLLEYYF